MDKILIKIRNSNLQKRLHVHDVRYPGIFEWENFEGEDWRLKYKDGFIRNLSDHIGKFVEFSFKKN